MNIPYTTERRQDTGVSNQTLGIWLFLASEVMLFGALFSSYALLRVSAPAWPAGRDVLSLYLGAANTITLFIMTAVTWRARTREGTNARRALFVATSLAFVFLAIKGVEWSGEIRLGLRPSLSTFLAMYFTLTGFHAFHVICGIVANIWVMRGTTRMSAAMTAGRMRALALYWAFVDAVWLIIFMLMYLS